MNSLTPSLPPLPAEAQPEADSDDCYGALKRSFIQEWEVLDALITTMVSSNGDVPMSDIKRAQAIMEKYQQQGQLFEPHLETMVGPLMMILRNQMDNKGNPKMGVVKKVCIVVHTLASVCGYKTVVKFFPNEASNLELAVTILQHCHNEIEETTSLREESTGQWETKCSLLLWLSILVLIPFDMASVDTSLAGKDVAPDSDIPPLVEKMLIMCKDYLGSPGPMREMAGVLLSRLLTRPDMHLALTSFMVWTQEAISASLNSPAGVFLVPGVIGAMAAIFKVGGCDILLPITPTAWQQANELSMSTMAARSLLLRKLLVKLIQRIGLVYLPSRVRSWQYKMVDSVIGQNLLLIPDDQSKFSSKQSLSCHIPASVKQVKFGNGDSNYQSGNVEHGEKEDDYDVPEIIEHIIEQLLNSLKDKDTVVRWSAAKGVGRITGRLTSSLADDVVASVLELFRQIEGDGAWHGGCLALAELAHRGLLIPERLHEVVPLIIQALHYDVRRGAHSIGAHVRDGGAYVCWAFARAYSPMLMQEHFKQLASALLTVACYDREVNCRRAASAAFQENIGRQGDFPHGIDLVNAADYFSLAARSRAYCSVAVYVAQFAEYRGPMVDELINRKIHHWDKELRELAAKALALLVRYDINFFGGPVFETLLPQVLAADLNQRHGATLAIAELILSLKDNGYVFSKEKANSIGGIVTAIEKARLYRGKGGEIMRSAVSRLIECEALAKIPLAAKIPKGILDTINENLKHPNDQIQVCAVAALKAFIEGYLTPANPLSIKQITLKHLKILEKDLNPAARRGSALALSVLPASFLTPIWKDVLNALCNACVLEGNPDEQDAETRANAVRGLVAVCKTLFNVGNEFLTCTLLDGYALISAIKEQVMESLFKTLDDYAVDNRGDVGSWVREAAIEGLEQCTIILCKDFSLLQESNGQIPTSEQHNTGEEGSALEPIQNNDLESRLVESTNKLSFNPTLAVRLIGGLVKQALEKINRVRDVAGRTLQNILHMQSVEVPFIPHKEQLMLLVPGKKSISWGDPADTFPRLVPFLKFPEYRLSVMSGLVVSVGGLADSLGKISLTCLLNFLQDGDKGEETQTSYARNVGDDSNWLGTILVLILKTYSGVDRVITPAFKTIDMLFSKGVFTTLMNTELHVAMEIATAVQTELKGTKDIVKIIAGINILGHLALVTGSVGMEAVSQLIVHLSHRYPKVRKACADQLYFVLVQKGEKLLKPDDLNAAQELVSETCWEGALQNTRNERATLAGLLHIHSALVPAVKSSSSIDAHLFRQAIRDENASYAALVSGTY